MRNIVVKDPIAIFSAEYIAHRYDAKVLVLIRHPAAFAASLLQRQWNFDFSDFTTQERLMAMLSDSLQGDLVAASENPGTERLDQAILLWNVIHEVIVKYRARHPDWVFQTHECLSAQPVEEFSKLYDAFGISFDDGDLDQIRRLTGGSSVAGRRRDSRKNIGKWAKILTPEQIAKIRESTEHC